MKIIFDIGGTNMRFSFVSGNKLGDVRKIPTPQNLELAKDIIIRSIKELSNGEKVESIVGGVPGTIKDGVIIDASNLKAWDGFDITSFLRESFCENVVIYNDADLAGLGESLYGSGRGSNIVAYIGVGTGTGGTRIVKGEIDANHIGFEPGHHIMDIANGKTFEDFVSGRGILEKYKRPAKEVGQEEMRKLLPAFAVGLYNVIRFWSPNVLVIGGSLVNEETAFKIEEIREAMKEIKTKILLPEIKQAELGDNSGLFGALAMTEKTPVSTE